MFWVVIQNGYNGEYDVASPVSVWSSEDKAKAEVKRLTDEKAWSWLSFDCEEVPFEPQS